MEGDIGVSLLAAILAASLALGQVARAPQRVSRMLVAGTPPGMSVVVMHYLGMYGMKIGGYIQWDHALVAASIVIAVLAATAALWLAFNTATLATRIGAALVMAVAVCAMHYTGMAAAEFVCTTANRSVIPQGFGYVSCFSISSLEIIAALSMVFLIAMRLLFQPAATAKGRSLQAKPSRGQGGSAPPSCAANALLVRDLRPAPSVLHGPSLQALRALHTARLKTPPAGPVHGGVAPWRPRQTPSPSLPACLPQPVAQLLHECSRAQRRAHPGLHAAGSAYNDVRIGVPHHRQQPGPCPAGESIMVLTSPFLQAGMASVPAPATQHPLGVAR
jgi:hypothetical protein